MSPTSPSPPSIARPEHCFFCFEVIDAALKRGTTQNSDADSDPDSKGGGGLRVDFPGERDDAEYPLFVTWNIYSSASALSRALGGGSAPGARLRGCIGTFEPMPLREGLRSYALTAAFKDRRFSPITAKEVPRLECGVSLLTPFEDCADYLDWTLGVHGIYIHFPNPALYASSSSPSSSSSGTPSSSSASSSASPSPAPAPTRRWNHHAHAPGPRTLSATYLPDVMPAQGWSKDEAVESAIRKAGWEGAITLQVKRSCKVRRYRSEKCSVTAEEWRAWREARAGEKGAGA